MHYFKGIIYENLFPSSEQMLWTHNIASFQTD